MWSPGDCRNWSSSTSSRLPSVPRAEKSISPSARPTTTSRGRWQGAPTQSASTYGANGRPEGVISPDGKEEVTVEAPADAYQNTWAHLALTYDGTAMRLYVNGELVDSTPTSGPQWTSGPLLIGCSKEWEEGFSGKIDEARVYDRALGAGEIGADAAAGIQTPQAGPVAAYSFDAGTGSIAEDVTGNEHEGTIEGAEWTERGRFGQALEFDGKEEDCVNVADSPDLRLTEELTVEAWVKPEHGDESGPIFFKEDGSSLGYSLYLGYANNGRPEGVISPDGKEEVTVEAPADAYQNTWAHLALTYDGTAMRLYVNGELVDSTPTSGPQWTSGPLLIGCSKEWEEGFSGKIDEARVYDRALGAGEIAPDLTPPTPPGGFDAVLEDEEGNATISWNGSIDPAEPTGTPGSGVKGYIYRYRLSASPEWTQWEEIMGPLAAVSGAEEKEDIHIQALAVDYEGNQSPVSSTVVEPAPVEVTVDSMAEPPPVSMFSEAADEALASIALEQEPTRSELPVAEASFVNDEKLCDGRGSNPCGHYNGINAARYAFAWTFPGAGDAKMERLHNHELQFFGGRGGDCANYASQALWHGGMEFMGTHGLNNPDEEAKGDNSGIYERSEGAWWSAYHYVDKEPPKIFDPPTNSWWNAHELYVHLLEFGLAERISHTRHPKPGDLIFLNQGEGIHTQNIDHVQIISKVHQNYVQVAQHSNSYHKAFWKVVKKLEGKYHQKPGVKKWNYFVLEPRYTAANLHEKSLGGIEE
jgi:hypothetical protein